MPSKKTFHLYLPYYVVIDWVLLPADTFSKYITKDIPKNVRITQFNFVYFESIEIFLCKQNDFSNCLNI